MLYHLSLCNDFSSFLEGDRSPQSIQNRGLTDDPDDANNLKTTVQKKKMLERMLVLIAEFTPSLLRNEIIKRSTGLSWIWQRIRKHFNFVQSEVNFLSLSNISRNQDERYETFYQRIVAHLEDNLLTVASGLHHDGVIPTSDEVMSPTTKRLVVYLWLQLIDSRLPAYVARVYAHSSPSSDVKGHPTETLAVYGIPSSRTISSRRDSDPIHKISTFRKSFPEQTTSAKKIFFVKIQQKSPNLLTALTQDITQRMLIPFEI